MADDKKKAKEDIIDAGEDDAMYITLEYDDGVVMETEVMGIFEAEGKDYIDLIPDDGSDDVYIYGYRESDENEDEFELTDIDDDAEFERAVDAFEKLMEDE